MKKKRVKQGRPPLPGGGRKPLNLTLPSYAKEWVKRKGGSAFVLAWVDAEIAREQSNQTGGK